MLGADERGLVSEAAGALQELLLVAAGGLGQHAQRREARLVGNATAAGEHVLDVAGGIGNFVFQAEATAAVGVLAIEVECALGDVKTQEQLVVRVDTVVLGADLHSRGLLS